MSEPMTVERLAEIEAEAADAAPAKHLEWSSAHQHRAELLAEVKRLRGWLERIARTNPDDAGMAAIRDFAGHAVRVRDDITRAERALELMHDYGDVDDAAALRRLAGLTCQDEGCPHYGTQHAH